MNGKKTYHQQVAEEIIRRMEEGTAPWQKPWKPGELQAPVNAATGKEYKGINALNLIMRQDEDPRWMTFKQAKDMGAHIKAGEKSTLIQYWQFQEERAARDSSGKIIKDENGQAIKISINLDRPRVFFANVFNGTQVEGLPPLPKKEPEKQFEVIEQAEKLIQDSGADIKHYSSDRAFYRPSDDTIHLPLKEQFHSEIQYYQTVLHELGHWTGHETRLDRDLSNPFGSEEYAKEELRAEIASVLVGSKVGLGFEPRDENAAYVKSWIKDLKDDPLEIFRAAADAEKIQNYLTNPLSRKQEMEQSLAPIGAKVHTRELVGGYHRKYNESFVYTKGKDGWSKQHIPDEFAPAPLDAIGPVTQPSKSQYARLEEMWQEMKTKEKIESMNQQSTKTIQEQEQKIEIHYISVPYNERNEAKKLGAMWDAKERSWYIPPGLDKEPFKKWPQTEKQVQGNQEKKDYISVPYNERNEAKKLGAQWDAGVKSWYIPQSVENKEPFEKWQKPYRDCQDPAMEPREELAKLMQSMGCNVTGDHPVMDGLTHRIEVDGDKHGNKSGFYVAHLDGRPAGYIKNNRTGEETRWKHSGYSMTKEETADLKENAARKQEQRRQETLKRQQETVERIKKQIGEGGIFKEVSAESDITRYHEIKGIKPTKGTYINPSVSGQTPSNNESFCVPLYNVEQEISNLQYIQPNGVKRYAYGGKKEGCFHIIGGGSEKISDLKNADIAIITEGYATGATIDQCGMKNPVPVIVAFDAGNLKPVAEAIKEKFPDINILIAADDDKGLEKLADPKNESLNIMGSVLGRGNVGIEKATLAAEAVGGKIVIPKFAPGEQDGKELCTDFNDLHKNSKLGMPAVKKQIQAAITSFRKEIKAAKTKTKEKTQSQKPKKKKVGAIA